MIFMAILQMIEVKESISELTRLLKSSTTSIAIKPRLKMLIAISGGVITTKELSQHTKANRNSIGQWKKIYNDKGIAGLLSEERGGKRRGNISDEQKAQLYQKLSNPKGGFRTYKEAVQWINETFSIEMNYHAVNMYLKRNFSTKLKVGRKTHVNQDADSKEFFKNPVGSTETH
jgi:transposase